MAKVMVGELINQLVAEIDEIDASEMAQGDKTKRYKAAASRYKSALFTDKRKYRGKGLAKRITANTYNAYMTRARKRFDDRLHHHFEKSIVRLAEKFPLYADELREWLTLPAAEIRQRHKDMTSRLKAIMSLAEEMTAIKFGTKSGNSKLMRLGNKYPAWKFALLAAAGEDWKPERDHLYKLFQQGTRLLEDMNGLRINHDVLYSLQLSAAERSSIQQRWGEVLSEKKRNTVLIDYPTYMQRIFEIIEAPVDEFMSRRVQMAPLAFALAAVSGRRMIEVMFRGEFTATGPNTVEFAGQAKKRTDDGAPRTIYTLCDAGLFIDRWNALRSCAAASDFELVIKGYGENDSRSENGRINAILAKAFNPWVKHFFNDDRRVYKDSRAIYARIAYEMWFRHDARWADVDEDVFFAEILGHDDENTQLHYKQFKLHNFSRTWHPESGNENTRLAALQDLDDEMPGFARGDAAVRMHEEVKKIIEEHPDELITNSTLRKLKFNPTLVARYLEFAATALEQAVGENGQYQLVRDTPPLVLDNETYAEEVEEMEAEDEDSEANDETLDDDEIESDDEAEPEPETPEATEPVKEEKSPAARPRFAAPHKRDDGTWKVSYEFDGKEFNWIGPADSIRDAMQKAWQAYHE